MRQNILQTRTRGKYDVQTGGGGGTSSLILTQEHGEKISEHNGLASLQIRHFTRIPTPPGRDCDLVNDSGSFHPCRTQHPSVLKNREGVSGVKKVDGSRRLVRVLVQSMLDPQYIHCQGGYRVERGDSPRLRSRPEERGRACGGVGWGWVGG